jgi:hypothetical protein
MWCGGRKRAWRVPWEAVSLIWEHLSPILKTLMAGLLGGCAGDPGAPTINAKHVDGGPLRGGAEDPGASIINTKNVDSGPPGSWCRRFGSTHHQRKKCQWWAPWEEVLEIRERPPSMQKLLTAGPMGGGAGDTGAPSINAKMLMVGPMGGSVRDPGAPSINTKNVDGGPPRRRCRRSWRAHHQCKKH